MLILISAAPHQPRLDWQMWFAALGNHNYNPWLVRMCYLLLHNQPSVTSLIQHNPFENSRPKYIKALLYTYHYSPVDSTTRCVASQISRQDLRLYESYLLSIRSLFCYTKTLLALNFGWTYLKVIVVSYTILA